jgi:hypothetical protein
VVEHPQVLDHVGLLFNGPSRHGRIALRLVIRRTSNQFLGWFDCTHRNGKIAALADQLYANGNTTLI